MPLVSTFPRRHCYAGCTPQAKGLAGEDVPHRHQGAPTKTLKSPGFRLRFCSKAEDAMAHLHHVPWSIVLPAVLLYKGLCSRYFAKRNSVWTVACVREASKGLCLQPDCGAKCPVQSTTMELRCIVENATMFQRDLDCSVGRCVVA